MEENYPAEIRIFTITGEDAEDKMQRLIDFASTLGSVAVSEVGAPQYLETVPETAADHLFMLLNRPGRYRDAWIAHVGNNPVHDGFSQAAVARVIAGWLPESGYEFEGTPPTAFQLKDRVSRALTGKFFTPELLDWFIGAFDFSDEDERSLKATYVRDDSTKKGTEKTALD